MEYMLLLYSDETQRPDFAPGSKEFEEMMGDWMALNQDLVAKGHFRGGASLASTDTATTVRRTFSGDVTVVDGPHAETKEQLGGYYLLEAESLDEVIEIAKSIPIPAGSFEIRPVDFNPSSLL